MSLLAAKGQWLAGSWLAQLLQQRRMSKYGAAARLAVGDLRDDAGPER